MEMELEMDVLYGPFYHIVVEMGGMDQILGVVKLDFGFDVSNHGIGNGNGNGIGIFTGIVSLYHLPP